MSDVSRYLPLSQRRHGDESGVTGDWRGPFAATLRSLADALEGIAPGQWQLAAHGLPQRQAPGKTQRQEQARRRPGATSTGPTVRSVVADAVVALTASPRARAAVRLRRSAAPAEDAPTAELVSSLRRIADVERKRRIADLSEAMVAAVDVARTLDAAGIAHGIVTDPLALGAVAVARSLSAPLAIRAVLGTVTLASTEGDWRVGRGPVRDAAASDIVLFLFGRAGVPEPSSGHDEARITMGTSEGVQMSGTGGFDLGGLEGVVGNLFGGKHFDIKALEPMWEQIQPFLRNLERDDIVEKIGSWANELGLPIVASIPDDVITRIQHGVKVPLANLIRT